PRKETKPGSGGAAPPRRPHPKPEATMKRKLIMTLLAIGAVGGFASGIAHLRHGCGESCAGHRETAAARVQAPLTPPAQARPPPEAPSPPAASPAEDHHSCGWWKR